MPNDWIAFVNGLKDDAGTLAKSELINLVTSTKQDASEFVQKQAAKTERYLNQLATGEITKDDFVLNMKDLKRLTEMEALKLEVAARASAQRLVDGIQNLILEKLVSLIP